MSPAISGPFHLPHIQKAGEITKIGVESQALLVGLACMFAKKSAGGFGFHASARQQTIDQIEQRRAHRDRSARFRPRISGRGLMGSGPDPGG
jgi:hypothetical protein